MTQGVYIEMRWRDWRIEGVEEWNDGVLEKCCELKYVYLWTLNLSPNQNCRDQALKSRKGQNSIMRKIKERDFDW